MEMKARMRSGATILTPTMNPALNITTDTDRVIPRPTKCDAGSPGTIPAADQRCATRHVLGASASALFPAGGHTGDKVTGDAMAAASLWGLSRGRQLDKAVRLDIAAGAAMLLTPGTAPCTHEYVERFFEMVANPIAIDEPRINDGEQRPATADQWLSTQPRTSP
jgi:fructose-1-phosphate kinase PfkB-like protein